MRETTNQVRVSTRGQIMKQIPDVCLCTPALSNDGVTKVYLIEFNNDNRQTIQAILNSHNVQHQVQSGRFEILQKIQHNHIVALAIRQLNSDQLVEKCPQPAHTTSYLNCS